ncbi:dTMP kinase [Paenibacillus mesophilus]|uniref:dTMP kinase n=1 Tax=Paenibacillus mesophilus TaxID=2582849 RepID=UPI00110EECAB|nr:dTMP kinase [Paenibacillus mesophilus]TMV44251.1 dTMP kinase [Paenibacillus mesophilus]
MAYTGYFITVEGGEGAGKTSAIRSMERLLQDRGFDVVVTREPGGIAIAEQIREVILDKRNVDMDGRTEALLYAAARRQHLVQKVIPALQEGKAVLCDRFIDSSLAYQGYARGLGIDEIFAMNRFAIHETMPDLTFFMDVSPQVGLARIHSNRDREVNRLDLEAVAFHERVRTGYLQLLERFPERIVRVDAEQSEEDVVRTLSGILLERLERRMAEGNICKRNGV